MIARGSLLDHLLELQALLESGPAGLMLDLDGTISEIVPEPGEARISDRVRRALTVLNRRLALVAIVTGRSAWQARDIVGLPELIYVGNHGIERLQSGRLSLAEEARPFKPFLAQLLGRLRARFPEAGIIFEDKSGSFAVHYRLASDPDEARGDVVNAINELAGEQVKLLMGKTVINVLPPLHLTKGSAVTSLVAEYGLSGAIVIGDDVTDIDAFRAAGHLSTREGFSSISVAVAGRDSPPGLREEADFTLESVTEVEDLLSWMVTQID